MKLLERRRADALDHYWDDVQRGRSEPPPTDIDAITVAVIERIQMQTLAADQDEAHIRIRRQLSAAIREQAPVTSAERVDLPPRNQRFARAWPSFRWGLAQVSVALILVMTIGLSIVTLLPRANQPSLTIPAASTSDDKAPTSLFELTIPPELVPTQSGLGEMIRLRIGPATSGAWLGADACCRGANPLLFYLLTGSVTMRAEAEAQVVPAGDSSHPVTISANTDFTLAAGDAVFLTLNTPYVITNQATTAVDLFLWSLEDGRSLDGLFPHTWAAYEDEQNDPMPVSPPGPVTLRMERLTMPADSDYMLPETIDPVNAFALSFDVGPYGPLTGHIVNMGDGRFVNSADNDATVYLITLIPRGAAASPVAATPDH